MCVICMGLVGEDGVLGRWEWMEEDFSCGGMEIMLVVCELW